MASPQKENGHTQIANELLEAFAKVDLKGTQFAMIFAIMRKTYGFHKKHDAISIEQFMEMMKMSRRAIIYNLQELEAKNIVFVKRSRNGEKNAVNIISLNKDYDSWLITESAPQVKKNRSSAKLRKQNRSVSSAKPDELVVQNPDEKVKSFAPTKETIQKKTKDNSKTDVLQGEQWNLLVDSFKDVNPFYEDFYRNRTERAALSTLAEKIGFEKLLATVQHLAEIVQLPYAPKITKPTELKRDFGKLIAFYKQHQSKLPKSNVYEV